MGICFKVSSKILSWYVAPHNNGSNIIANFRLGFNSSIVIVSEVGFESIETKFNHTLSVFIVNA